MKGNSITAIVFFCIALFFYILSVKFVMSYGLEIHGITFLIFGSVWFCLAAVYLNHSKDKNDSDNK